jgi:ABC-type branched-subunit amino acid transport system substrate-binding protein
MEKTTQMLNSALLALKDYGQVQGFDVEIITFDDQCDADLAEGIKDQVLANDQIVGVLGLNCPDVAIQELPHFEADNLVVLASAITLPGLESYGPEVTNRFLLDDDQLAVVGDLFTVEEFPAFHLFSASFEAEFGTSLGDFGLPAAATYDGMMILLGAVDGALWINHEGTLVIGRQAIAQAVRATWAYEGASGYISLDESGSRLQPVVPDTWGDVIVNPGEMIQIAVLTPKDLFPDVLPQAANFAIEEFGLIHGFEVGTIVYEDMCNESNGISAAPEVVSHDQIAGVLGPLCSRAVISALPLFEEAHIVMVSPGATRPDLPDFGRAIFNRTILDESQRTNLGYENENYIAELESVQEFFIRLVGWLDMDIGAVEDFWVFYAYTFDATNILLQAIEEVAQFAPDGSLVIGREALVTAVRAVENYEGVTGTITFTYRGNRVP